MSLRLPHRSALHAAAKQAPGAPSQRFRHCLYSNPNDRHNRTESKRFKCFTYDKLLARDKVNLDITWLRDPDLDDGDHLQPPEVIAQEIVEGLQALVEVNGYAN